MTLGNTNGVILDNHYCNHWRQGAVKYLSIEKLFLYGKLMSHSTNKRQVNAEAVKMRAIATTLVAVQGGF